MPKHEEPSTEKPEDVDGDGSLLALQRADKLDSLEWLRQKLASVDPDDLEEDED